MVNFLSDLSSSLLFDKPGLFGCRFIWQFLLIIPVEFIKWIVILLTGAMSGAFVTLNLKSFVQTNDLAIVPIAAFVLQMGLAIFIKMWFFP